MKKLSLKGVENDFAFAFALNLNIIASTRINKQGRKGNQQNWANIIGHEKIWRKHNEIMVNWYIKQTPLTKPQGTIN